MLNNVMSSPHNVDIRKFDRFGLQFIFPNRRGFLFIPFYQNPKITESKKAKYVRYSPIGLNDQVQVYTGSESRSFKVDFDLNFLHMAANNLEGIKQYLEHFPEITSTRSHSVKWKASVFNDLSVANNIGWFIGVQGGDSVINKVGEEFYNYVQENTATKHTTLIDCYNFIINIIRKSSYNDEKNPLLGPPLIRIKFGPMFDKVLCVCNGYNIKDKELTYDVETGMPASVSISLDLTEIRRANIITPEISVVETPDKKEVVHIATMPVPYQESQHTGANNAQVEAIENKLTEDPWYTYKVEALKRRVAEDPRNELFFGNNKKHPSILRDQKEYIP